MKCCIYSLVVNCCYIIYFDIFFRQNPLTADWHCWLCIKKNILVVEICHQQSSKDPVNHEWSLEIISQLSTAMSGGGGGSGNGSCGSSWTVKIQSRMHQKHTTLRTKIQNFSGEGAQPLPSPFHPLLVVVVVVVVAVVWQANHHSRVILSVYSAFVVNNNAYY